MNLSVFRSPKPRKCEDCGGINTSVFSNPKCYKCQAAQLVTSRRAALEEEADIIAKAVVQAVFDELEKRGYNERR